ncbi:MAG TPA: tRNA lysidine(34) synthetase TilS [Candidatus Limnocylindria bacterium]|nr:tRNA lysidine(34) synthetase TilS [Candidatus Limnocylindria bacterium]
MDVDIEPGTYVVAVSGGVDSMALLHLLHHKITLSGVKPWRGKFIVAHFEHGVREDSDEDLRLVQDAARRYGLPFVYDRGYLGSDTSEDAARQARYEFLHGVRKASGARAVITAHHQDDLLETAIHNMLRGTGRRGLVSLRSRPGIHRPLLHMPKADLIAYAKDQGLVWREDSTNMDLRYRRNYIRHKLLPQFEAAHKKEELLQHIRALYAVHEELETHLINYLHLQPGLDRLDRHSFIMLPHAVAREVLAAWLRRHGVQNLTTRTLERLIVAAKTYNPGAQTDVNNRYTLGVGRKDLALRPRER